MHLGVLNTNNFLLIFN